MRIAIGNDHVAYDYKQQITDYVQSLGHETTDFGAHSDERTDYPIWGESVARAVAAGDYDRGILICGSGVGISIAANKVPGIRAVVCSEPYSALLSREHNDTNVLAFGARVVGIEVAKMIIKTWIDGQFEGGRHADRISQITNIERGEKRPS